MQTRLSQQQLSQRFPGKDILNVEAKRRKLEKSYLKAEQLLKLWVLMKGKFLMGKSIS